MRKLGKIILLFIILVFISGYLFIRFRLNSVLATQISKTLNRPVNIERIDLSLPFSISIKNLVIFDMPSEKEDSKFLKVDEIKITPAIIPFLKGKIFLYSLLIENPQLRILRLTKDRFNFSDIISTQKTEPGAKGFPLLILKFKIDNGEVNFVDKAMGDIPFIFFLKDIDFTINKLIFPLSDMATEFNLETKLGRENIKELAEIDASGWINFTRKDMEARFSLRDLNYLHIKPYLGEIISGKVNQGTINFYTDAISKSNELNLKCRLEIEKIVAEETSSKVFGIYLDKIIEVFKDKEGRISFDFEMNTKLDQPKIDYAKIGESLWKKITDKLASKVPSLIMEKVIDKTKDGVEKVVTDPLGKIKEKLQISPKE